MKSGAKEAKMKKICPDKEKTWGEEKENNRIMPK